jgi:hypothetical protein
MRNIDWEKALTEEDMKWLSQRMTPELEDKINQNKSKFKTSAIKTGEFQDDYDKWKVDELKTEAEGREPAIDVTGLKTKVDLIAALRTWDAEHPDAVEVL